MEKEYLLSFSSFYKAAYARDVLEAAGFASHLRRLPPQLAHSCSTGLHLSTDSIGQVRRALDEKQIETRVIYAVQRTGRGTKIYRRL